MSQPPFSRPAIPRTVWTLGFVSMLMDISSEMIHALLPVFMMTTLGASALTVGLVEGFAEATAAITKLFSGILSDRLGKRKWLAAFGYGLSALTKPIFPLAGSAGEVMAARFMDRIGKGIRGAPRDALIADVTEPGARGAAFGLRQTLDTIGAVAGPLIAIGLMALYAGDMRQVFWWAVFPGLLAVGLLMAGVREPDGKAPNGQRGWPIRKAELKRMPVGYWLVILVAVAFTFARFSEAFLILAAQHAGLAIGLAPLALIAMNLVYSLSAAPLGRLADGGDGKVILIAGMMVLVIADLLLALAPGVVATFIGIALWGLHMGMTQGLLAAMIADRAPEDLRGTAFGLYNLVTGIVLLAASALAGFLWDAFGPQATFFAGAGFALLAGLLATGVLSGKAAEPH